MTLKLIKLSRGIQIYYIECPLPPEDCGEVSLTHAAFWGDGP